MSNQVSKNNDINNKKESKAKGFANGFLKIILFPFKLIIGSINWAIHKIIKYPIKAIFLGLLPLLIIALIIFLLIYYL